MQLLPWTATYHHSGGTNIKGIGAVNALNDILWDLFSDKDGFICVDYKVDSEDTRYRMALTSNTFYNGQCDKWPFGHYANQDEKDGNGDVVMTEQELPERTALIRASVTSNPGGFDEKKYDVSAFFVALDGPKNNFSDMSGITIEQLLYDTQIPRDFLSGSTIDLSTIQGRLVLPVDTPIGEAHTRLCVMGTAN